MKWSRRTIGKISWLLQQKNIVVSTTTVARLLHKMDYSLHVNRKMIATDSSPDRAEQFD